MIKIERDEKGRELATSRNLSIDESLVRYSVASKWAGRVKHTVPMTLSEAEEKYQFLSKLPNHDIWIQEQITLGSLV